MKSINDKVAGTDKPDSRGSVTNTVGLRLGQHLIESGKITESDVSRITRVQRELGLLFGEAAVQLGLLTRNDLQHALSQHFAYPYANVAGTNLSPSLSAAHKPFGAQAEAFRTLRSQLTMRWFNDRRKVIAVTSPRGAEDSSRVAANLAISYAQLGERTMYIDANMRAPLHEDLFGVANGAGLSSVLLGRSTPNEALAAVAPFDNLAVMRAGPTPPNPQELLGRIAFSYLVETAPVAYDIVIINTPPILEYADGQLIAAITGGCLLTARRDVTRLADIEHAKLQITPTGAELVGLVLT